jgi:hypothetical protein
MKYLAYLFFTIALIIVGIRPATAEIFKKLDKPPLTEKWFGIYVDSERVGFYRQKISETSDGYRMEGDGSVRMKVMGFSKESSIRECYLVEKNLAMLSFEIEQTINGIKSSLSGKISDGSMRIYSVNGDKTTKKQLRFRGDIYPGPALNLYPLMRDTAPGKSYKILTFDPEEVRVKEIKISVIGAEKAPDGQSALKLRNNLYPFVTNDIWMDSQGNTIFESVRDGLVTTKSEAPKTLGAFVGSVALAKKDLIYDFSLVRANPHIKEQQKLKGLTVQISGWDDALPLLQEGGQVIEKSGEGRITISTGSAVPTSPEAPTATTTSNILTVRAVTAPSASYLKPAEKIEADAPKIVAKVKELTSEKMTREDVVRALVSWTADWLKDTVDDGGSALTSFMSRTGNCQTHSRLYTAMARAAGIPTRFVSGLVYLDGKGFLYHSWAESWLAGRWVAVDPTYNQAPADPTHLKFFEGHLPEDMSPIIAIIGRIKISVLEARY